MNLARDGKAEILTRVRTALSVPTAPEIRKSFSSQADPAFLPPGGDTYEEQRQRFADMSARLKTEFTICPKYSDAVNYLRSLMTSTQPNYIAAHHASLIDMLMPITERIVWTDGGYDRQLLEQCQVGITTCEALVAQSGSILVSSRQCGGRALSVLPPHHVVVATKQDLLPDLRAAFERVRERYGLNFPSMLSFITGPSRTGDIERILVLGAHGPRKLTVLLIEDLTADLP